MKKVYSQSIGIVLLALICVGIYCVCHALVIFFLSLKSEIAAAIVVASSTILVSIISILLTKLYEARERVQKEHREKKIPVYEDLLKFMSRIIMAAKTGTGPSEKEVVDFVMDFNQRMMVWGSDEVLKAWATWRRCSVKGDGKVIELVFLYEKLILAIRRDLGHKNKNLGQGDVLALFVNDIDEMPRGS